MIWHLPFVRAIASLSPEGQVTFLAPPTSRAKDLLGAEPRVLQTIYFEHAGSEFERGVNLIRLARLLWQMQFQTVWILDGHSGPLSPLRLQGFLSGLVSA